MRHLFTFAVILAMFGCSPSDLTQRECNVNATSQADAGCEVGEVCLFGRNRCVPQPVDGVCPDGYTVNWCATGSCPICRDCVAACVY